MAVESFFNFRISAILASNVFQEIEGKEGEYCCNQIISRAIENLLPYSNDEEFAGFIEKFSSNLRPIFNDPFGSHVLQQTIVVSYQKYTKCKGNSNEDDDDDGVKQENEDEKKLSIRFYEYILKISQFLFNNLYDFIWDTYSNAIARTVFNVLSGNPIKGEIKPEERNKKTSMRVPQCFTELLKKFAKKIMTHPQFDDFCYQSTNSGLLQSLLVALGVDSLERREMMEQILKNYEKNQVDLLDECNEPFSRLLEVIASIGDKQTVKNVYKMVVKDKLVDLSKSKCGNFLVQKLIGNCKSKKTFGKIFAKIEPEMENVLGEGNTGVVLSIVKACRRLEICQGGCMTVSFLLFSFILNDDKMMKTYKSDNYLCTLQKK